MTSERQEELIKELRQDTITLERVCDIFFDESPYDDSIIQQVALMRFDELLTDEEEKRLIRELQTMTEKQVNRIRNLAPCGSNLEYAATKRYCEFPEEN